MVSSQHCKLALVRDAAAGKCEVWLEDCSNNGTFVNEAKVGKGNKVRLHEDDKVGLLAACGGEEPPLYAYVFQDLTAELSAAEVEQIFMAAPKPRDAELQA